MRRRIGWTAGWVLALAVSAHAATTLKLDVKPGVSYAFDNTMNLDLNLGLNAGGQQMNLQQTLAQVSAGTVEVLEAVDGKINKAKISFDAKNAQTMTTMGQTQSSPFALAGKTVTATRNGDAVDIQPADGIDEQTRDAVVELIKGEDGIYPARPVEVGDEWDGTLGSGDMKLQMKFKLDRVATINGREVAELSTNGQLAGVVNGMNMKGNVVGPMVIDVATGLIASGNVAGDLKIDGNVVEQGQQIAVDGAGKMSVTAKSTINAPASRVAPGGEPGHALNPPNGPQTPAHGAPTNPLGGDAAPAPSLSGTYAGDGLTMTVTGDDIRLELGASKFTGKITRRSGVDFSGTFSHDGKSFDFTGIPNGDSVDFTTGTKTYKLKKQGAANPLG